MRKFGALLFTFACAFGTVVACSSAESRPGAATSDTDGSSSSSGGSSGDSGLEGGGGDAALCGDKQKDGDETDVDCGGGTCAPCAINGACKSGGDCAAGLACTPAGFCASCSNGIKDGMETDVDCGGEACTLCGIGKGCKVGTDCASKTCNASSGCGCPVSMTNVALGGNNGAFCIDTAEVTQGQYAQFIAANVPITSQTGSCLTANTSYVPANAWPPHTGPLDSSGVSTLPFNDGLPVHFVDWCDASAYCTWAGKQLCGTLDGKSLAPADANDATKSAWFNVCTASTGTKTYPYGLTFDGTNCNGTGMGEEGPDPSIPKDVTSAHYGYAQNSDTGVYEVADWSTTGGVISDFTHVTCNGGANGTVYQLSGNVAEWEDDCDGTDATSNCRLRGGSYAANNDQTALSCAAVRSLARIPANPVTDLADVGFRCCQY